MLTVRASLISRNVGADGTNYDTGGLAIKGKFAGWALFEAGVAVGGGGHCAVVGVAQGGPLGFSVTCEVRRWGGGVSGDTVGGG